MYKHYVSLFTLVKHETPYVREWVTFHLSVGVEHFYIVENDKKSALPYVLEDFISQGVVSVYCFPARREAQKRAFNRGIEKLVGVSKWVGFLDIDEFAIPSAGRSLADILRPFERHPGLAVNWVEYGDSGHLVKPQGWVTENYLERGPINFEFPAHRSRDSGVDEEEPQNGGRAHNTHVKCFVQPELTEQFRSAHHFKYKNGETAVDENFRPVMGPFSHSVSVNRIRINHYWSKSAEERLQKISKGRVSQNSAFKKSPYSVDYAARRSAAASGVRDYAAFEISSRIDSNRKLAFDCSGAASVRAPRLRASFKLWVTEHVRNALRNSRKLVRKTRRRPFRAAA